jgi:tetratricopeptide (TPR) repeat protein
MDTSHKMETALKYHQEGELIEAQKLLEQILQTNPNHPQALHSLGLIAHQIGEQDLAHELIQKAIGADAHCPQFHYNLGVVLEALGKKQEALRSYDQAVLQKDDYLEAFNNAGNILQSLGRYSDAVEKYNKVLSIKPDYVEVYHNMAVALSMMDKYDDAVRQCENAITLRPDYAQAYNTKACALQMLGRHLEAIDVYRKALKISPDYDDAHVNLAMALLLLGKFEQGWVHYRRRMNTTNIYCPHDIETSRWDGSQFEGKKLLIWCEQGIGDAINFVRYLPRVKDKGGYVTLAVKKSLLRLFSKLDGLDELVQATKETTPTGRFDLHVPLMDLPLIFNTTVKTIDDCVPYLFADSTEAQSWRTKLTGPEFKVGIVWAGSSTHKNDRHRSCSLEHFLGLTQVPSVRLYALQKGPAANQLREIEDNTLITNIADQFEDFADTAAAIENLDLVISVDTAVLHLAGAMGKPVWALLPFVPDFRWMLDRTDTPWYPTMTLFRQNRLGGWDDVFERLTEQLKQLVAYKSPQTVCTKA